MKTRPAGVCSIKGEKSERRARLDFVLFQLLQADHGIESEQRRALDLIENGSFRGSEGHRLWQFRRGQTDAEQEDEGTCRHEIHRERP